MSNVPSAARKTAASSRAAATTRAVAVATPAAAAAPKAAAVPKAAAAPAQKPPAPAPKPAVKHREEQTAATSADERASALAFIGSLATEVSKGTVNLPCFPDVVMRIR